MKEFKILDDKIEHKESVIDFSTTTFKLEKFFSVVREAFQREGFQAMIQRFQPLGGIINQGSEWWFNKGIECRILKPHQGWIKGKIRINISLEFCPDEPESQLDDIRQKL